MQNDNVVILLGTTKTKQEELLSTHSPEFCSVLRYDTLAGFRTKLRSKSFDVNLVIVDLLVPSSGGMRAIKDTINKEIPVLAIGQYRPMDMLEKAIHTGANNAVTYEQALDNLNGYVTDIIGIY